MFKWLFVVAVVVTEYTAPNAAGNVMVPDVEFTVTLPHCNNNPLGNLVYPGVAASDAPNVTEFVVNTAEFVMVKTLATVKLALTVVLLESVELPTAVNVPLTDILPFAVNDAVLVAIVDVLTNIVLTDEFAFTLTAPSVLTTIDAELLLPVINVRFVDPLAVFTVVVVKLDIIL